MYIGNIPALDARDSVKNADDVDKAPLGKDIRTVDSEDELESGAGQFVKITNHQMEADIQYPREGSGKQSVTQTIKIYNPTKETTARVKSGSLLILKAGYNTTAFLPVICAAQIKKVTMVKSNQDKILTVLCSEAYNIRSNVKYARTFAKGFTYKDAILDLLDVYAAYGVPTGSLDFTDKATTQQFSETYSIMGSINKALDRLCQGADLKWYIAGGSIFIQPKVKTESDYINVLTVRQENVKGSVEIIDDTSNKSAGQKTTRTKGIRFTINLNGNLNKADGVEILKTINSTDSFNEYVGRYLITSVSHTLSFEGDSWDTTIEARG